MKEKMQIKRKSWRHLTLFNVFGYFWILEAVSHYKTQVAVSCDSNTSQQHKPKKLGVSKVRQATKFYPARAPVLTRDGAREEHGETAP